MFILLITFVSQADATVIWQEDFNNYPRDWLCGTTPSASSLEVHCTAPLKRGRTVSDYSGMSAELKGWDGKTPPYINGIVDAAGRTGKGYRINLRKVCFVNYENILDSKKFINNSGITYLRWYQRDSWSDFHHSSYEKLFRLKGADGYQFAIPGFYGGAMSKTYFALGLIGGSSIYWKNFNLNTYKDAVATDGIKDKWMCYELKMDIVNNVYEFFVNGTSMGEKSASRPLDITKRLTYVTIGGNQNNVYCSHGTMIRPCWNDGDTFKTRDYDDIVVSTERIGCEAVK